MNELTALSIIYIVLCYTALSIFTVGFAERIYKYAVIPSPLKIPTTPAPVSRAGVFMRMAGEIFFFTSLFKGNKWTWVGGYLFHVALAFVLIRHLRYFLVPVPEFVELAGPVGVWAGALLVPSAVYLMARRAVVDRTRYISSPADYMVLVLIVLIAVTGLLMNFVARADVISAKAFIMGIVTFHPVNIPADPLFLVHLALVLVLLVYMPFSKLLHAGGVFFSPTRGQVDDCREKRHVNPWTA